MKVEFKQLAYKCDRCGCFSAPQITTNDIDFPEGWTRKEIDDCGLTGYTKKVELCKSCSLKKNHGTT